MDVLLFDWRLPRAIENTDVPNFKWFKPRWIPIPDLPLQVSLSLSLETYDQLDSDPLLLQAVTDDCQAAFAASLPTIVPRLQALDAQCGAAKGDFVKYAEGRKQALQQIGMDIEQARANAERSIQDRLTALQTEQRDYRAYRAGVVVKIASGSAGLVGAGLGLAGAVVTGGASLAVSIIGTYRAIVEGGRALWECIQEADRVQMRVMSDLHSLQQTYARDSRLGVAREMAASTVNAVFKLPVDLTNVPTLEKDNALWRGKLTHLRFLAHELSTQLAKMLDESKKLQAQLSADPDSRNAQAALSGFQSDINKLLTIGFYIPSMGRRVQIQKSHQDAERGLAAQAEVARGIEELKAGRSHGVDWFDSIAGFVAGAALTGVGYGIKPPDLREAKEVVDVVLEGAEKIKEIYDIAADNIQQVKQVEERIKNRLFSEGPPPQVALTSAATRV